MEYAQTQDWQIAYSNDKKEVKFFDDSKRGFDSIKNKLLWICNEFYYDADRLLPFSQRFKKENENEIAIVEGVVASTIIANRLEATFPSMQQSISDLVGTNITLKHAAMAGSLAALAFGISYFGTSKGKKFVEEHPTFSAGVIGVLIGAGVKAALVLGQYAHNSSSYIQ